MTKGSGGSRRSKCLSLVIDIIGLSLGVLIMTLIAFYEDSIQLLLTDE